MDKILKYQPVCLFCFRIQMYSCWRGGAWVVGRHRQGLQLGEAWVKLLGFIFGHGVNLKVPCYAKFSNSVSVTCQTLRKLKKNP